MTTEQLQAARAEKWRQKANPLLTIEEAEAWIDSTGISLFLPRKNQLQIPAPSFVEAVLGETSATPAPHAIQNAFEMAIRLFSDQKATPLNLLGNASEQPDFLASREALPYVFALRGDREIARRPAAAGDLTHWREPAGFGIDREDRNAVMAAIGAVEKPSVR